MSSLVLFTPRSLFFIMTQGLLLLSHGQSVTRESWWKKTHLTGVRFLDYKGEFHNTTITACASHCSANRPCSSFSVHRATGRCLIFENRVVFGVNMAKDEGYTHYWILNEHCPTGQGYIYNASAKVCYRGEFYNPMTWTDAQIQCQSEGGHLYIANTQDKLDIVTQYVLDNVQAITTAGRVLLGASDVFEEGWWHWLDGSPVAKWMWGPGQPDNFNGIQHCILVRYSAPDVVDDDNWDVAKYFMCEVPLL